MAADHGGRAPDLYQLLGVPQEASREEIALAWRHRARAEHPDARPADADAPDRFRALAEAWQVLGDPVRRAAYDAALTPVRPTGPTRVPVRYVCTPEGGRPQAWPAEPPLRAGPVRVERPRPAPPAADWEEEARMAILAGLTLRYLGRPW